VNKSIRQKLANSKRRIRRRLDRTDLRGCSKPMMTASNIHHEIGAWPVVYGPIGADAKARSRYDLPSRICARFHSERSCS
jgi:hypothetical protein